MKHTTTILLILSTVLLAACSTTAAPVAVAPEMDATSQSENAVETAEQDTAVLEADLAFFQEKAGESTTRLTSALLESCPEVIVPGMRTFPLAEPIYDGKRVRDLNPFAAALDNFSAERVAELDMLLVGLDIPGIQSLMESGDLSAVELVTYYVDRIQRYDIDQLNSVLMLNPEALAIAAKMDDERAAGAELGPLHGMPVLLKDNIATGDGMTTTAGAYALKDWQADRDASLVQQLRDAGAIILGKANLSEWANYMDPCMPSGFSAVGG